MSRPPVIELDVVHVDEICAATRGSRAIVFNNSLQRDSALSTGFQISKFVLRRCDRVLYPSLETR